MAYTCQQSLPVFSASIDLNNISPPSPPLSQPALDLFHVKLQLFLTNTVEGYNNKLIAYTKALDRFDKEAKRAIGLGRCSQEEYDAIRIQVDEELAKSSADYLEPYRQGVNAYREYDKWYYSESEGLKRERERQRAIRQLQGALPISSQTTGAA